MAVIVPGAVIVTRRNERPRKSPRAQQQSRRGPEQGEECLQVTGVGLGERSWGKEGVPALDPAGGQEEKGRCSRAVGLREERLEG